MESFCRTVFFCQLPLLGVSERILLPSRVFCPSQKPFIWSTNMPRPPVTVPVTLPAAEHTLPAKTPPGNALGRSRKLISPLWHILVTFCLAFPEPQTGPLGKTRPLAAQPRPPHSRQRSALLTALCLENKNRKTLQIRPPRCIQHQRESGWGPASF